MKSTNTLQLKASLPENEMNGAIGDDWKDQSLASVRSRSDEVFKANNGDSGKDDGENNEEFKSSFGLFISSLASAVGTGNIWRFPKTVAGQSDSDGALAFYIVWGVLLFSWSIPLILIESSLGRFTLNTPLGVFLKFWGLKYIGFGLWLYVVIFFIAAYYQVVVGWCFYYLYVSVTATSLPATREEGEALFNAFAANSKWPLLTQFMVVCVTGIVIYGGINWIEYANMVFVPILWFILIFMFGWTLTRPYAEVGIAFLFTPNWSGFLRPELWMSAIAQNGFDTNAGMGILLIYSSFTGRKTAIVRNSMTVPTLNNFCSFFTSITIYGTIFSITVSNIPTTTRADIVDMMRQAGPASTGLTFTWMPVLLSEVGLIGRVFCCAFFLCLSVAGVLSFTAIIKCVASITEEFGIPRKYAVILSIALNAVAGSASAVNLNILANQDNTWAYGLVISGFFLSMIVIIYGPFRYFRVLVNHFSRNDWKIPRCLIPIISVLVPLQAILLLAYWVYGSIATDPDWNKLTTTSISTTVLEWAVAVIVIILVTIVIAKFWKSAFADARRKGYDPHDPNLDTVLYEEETDVKRVFSNDDRLQSATSSSTSK